MIIALVLICSIGLVVAEPFMMNEPLEWDEID
ncbi:hypothetical protein RAZWK3B_11607 [Roseobacter sp. AzwK-3b]|nr:hypothetical protein RAZWK3B_11607 [Roseobacter sp. AzwK-3b]